MRSYEDYEKACEEVRRTNSELLQIFEEELKAKGLSSKAIRNHMENVELYISDYLLREEAQPMEKGVAPKQSPNADGGQAKLVPTGLPARHSEPQAKNPFPRPPAASNK